ncbi:phosphoribosylformylglycinamidine cyclo-ligase [Anaerorhabdus furcosa]|uniref:Phosphoribosylformylglycinamidine cyclo-ligase n=1 Tax=Anaerorhabdus furcosa TaxID=118967 RepID=A0A1T4N4M4_9FIRM|nr:phosphoribosylformylglycinamidine cyclo-ligase [Anaerorhabdus furcosa]SJZ73808.1 phosphoribosylformylglycinamidine cyclo-ligase [Anaerorhabdus furcosa]
MSKSYKDAGVNLEAGYESVERIKKHIKRTERLGVMGGIGAFGGLFDLSSLKIKEPVLVSGTDGVGTKLKLAMLMNKHDTIGQDVVAMCVNDVLAQGAVPLFFLDYIAVGKNHPEQIEEIVKGVCDGCVLADCALVGGETAEMPDMYGEDDYDIAGFTVGAVEKSKIITPEKVQIGDVVIALPSSGVHSNGFSLVRKIVLKDNAVDLNSTFEGLDKSIGETLLTPTRIYVKPVKAVLDEIDVHGIAHITGGGFYENMPRCLNNGQGIEIQKGSYTVLPIFNVLKKLSNMDEHEMYNVFNMGVGMILVVNPSDVDKTMEILKVNGESPSVIGKIIEGEGVTFK